MIVVNFMGGLGNQMFQYACGLGLSAATGLPVKYVMDTYQVQNTFNGFELERVFGLQLPIASSTDLRDAVGVLSTHPQLRRLIMKYGFLSVMVPKAVFERNLNFEPELAQKVSKGGYLHGYWQSEKYFAMAQESVRAAFKFRGVEELSIEDQSQLNVSLHVRRGDYLSSGSVHAACDSNYYRRALETLDVPAEDSTLYIFSDDPDWAENELATLHPKIVTIRGNLGVSSYKDMYLMSLCDHNIIANSSFSWWGAWLNANPDKRVIAPRNWFSTNNLDASDIIPENWELA